MHLNLLINRKIYGTQELIILLIIEYFVDQEFEMEMDFGQDLSNIKCWIISVINTSHNSENQNNAWN